jgi:ABC-2 type transport system ATP-binding protein
VRALLDASGLPYESVETVAASTEDLVISAVEREPAGTAPGAASMNRNEPSVVVENLTKRFGPFVAVDNISFEARHGEIFGFLGPNGSGKSTTIRILCGLLKPSSGRARGGHRRRCQSRRSP